MCANWVGDNRDMSPDRNERYQLDNVGLQIGLGLPIQLIGVSLMNNFNRSNQNRNRGRGGQRRNNYERSQPNKVDIQKTCDGIPIRKLYITNIASETQRVELMDIFGSFGRINNLFMAVSKNDRHKQFAFITFVNPMDAARVLSQQRFQDMRGRTMFALPADSWHQPRELPDGTIDWSSGRKTPARQEEESEEEGEQSTEESASRVEIEIPEGSLNMLNDDCLLHIFSFLSFKEITAVETVCKRWQALSFRMWRCLHELNFRTDGPFSKLPRKTEALDQYLKRCGSSLTTLDLTAQVHGFDESTLAVVAKHCENLEVLRVNMMKVATRSLAHLARACPRLKQLYMEDCRNVSDADLNTLLPKCPDLKVLHLSNMGHVTGKFLANIQGPITNLHLNDLPKGDAQYLVKGLEKMSATLETVTLNTCFRVPPNSSVFEHIVAAVPNLTSLSIRCDAHSLSPLGQLKKLTSLNLSFNNSVNDTALTAIVEGCEELTSLNLSASGVGCAGVLSERGLSTLARLRKLTHLNISYLEATNNMALKNFTARNCKLKSLECRGCPELTDEGAESVVTLCNELELFDLSGCNGVSDKTADTARTSVKMRTNNTPLRLIVGGTKIPYNQSEENEVPLLTLDFMDLSEPHLRPDFIEDMFFPPSDSDDDEDLDHLCERIGCDCDFDFDDDLFDPTLVNDETQKFDLDFDDDWVNGDTDYDDDDDDDDDDEEEYEPPLWLKLKVAK